MPAADTKALHSVLSRPDVCGFDNVDILLNPGLEQVLSSIDALFSNCRGDDLALLYFSGHGVLDRLGRLYLALFQTVTERLLSTALPASLVREAMDQSLSRRQILILDCCYSGAFDRSGKGAVAQPALTSETFDVRGYGRVVLTSSSATQKSWEGNQFLAGTDRSLFTHYLVEGLETGNAAPGNQLITIEQLYGYTHDQVLAVQSSMTPQFWSDRLQGTLVIARNPNWDGPVSFSLGDPTAAVISATDTADNDTPVARTENRRATPESARSTKNPRQELIRKLWTRQGLKTALPTIAALVIVGAALSNWAAIQDAIAFLPRRSAPAAAPETTTSPASPSQEDRDPVGPAGLQEDLPALLLRADGAFSAGRLTPPAADNAQELYREVLARDPKNPQAHTGLDRIVATLLERVRAHCDLAHWDAARAELSQAAAVGARTDDVETRRVYIEQAEQALPKALEITPASRQHALRAIGYETVEVDGNLREKKTDAAIRQFQKRNGFDPTGTLRDLEIVSLVRQAAAAGDRESQYQLGAMAATGVGIPPDPGLARRSLEASADQGYAYASQLLGTRYLGGQNGFTASRETACRYIAKAVADQQQISDPRAKLDHRRLHSSLASLQKSCE